MRATIPDRIDTLLVVPMLSELRGHEPSDFS